MGRIVRLVAAVVVVVAPLGSRVTASGIDRLGSTGATATEQAVRLNPPLPALPPAVLFEGGSVNCDSSGPTDPCSRYVLVTFAFDPGQFLPGNRVHCISLREDERCGLWVVNDPETNQPSVDPILRGYCFISRDTFVIVQLDRNCDGVAG